MSIETEISRIQSNVQNTISAIQQTGVPIPEDANSDNLPALAVALANEKQDKLTGVQGQIVGFDANGDAVPQAAPNVGVTSFNGRSGAVSPQSGDYTAAQVGAVPTNRTINGQALSANITLDAGDVGADVSGAAAAVQTNLNSHTGNTNNPHQVTAAQVGALPITGGTLEGNLNGKYFTSTWLQTTAVTEYTSSSYKGVAILDGSGWVYYRTLAHFLDDIGAVPTSRTINGQALSADVTLTAEDIGGATNPVLYTATLPDYGWTNNSYTLTVPGILADEAKQLIMVTPYLQKNTEAYQAAGIVCTYQAENQLTFSCESVPENPILIFIVMINISLSPNMSEVYFTPSGAPNSITMTFVPGMTWADFVESEYNTAGLSVDMSNNVITDPYSSDAWLYGPCPDSTMLGNSHIIKPTELVLSAHYFTAI